MTKEYRKKCIDALTQYRSKSYAKKLEQAIYSSTKGHHRTIRNIHELRKDYYILFINVLHHLRQSISETKTQDIDATELVIFVQNNSNHLDISENSKENVLVDHKRQYQSYINQYRSILDSAREQTISEHSLIRCGKCKSTAITMFQRQTRSADEPMTQFYQCGNCNNKWRFNG